MYELLDTFLIAPYRWLPHPMLALWFGSVVLALYATLVGELTSGLLYIVNRKYYTELQRKMTEMHNKSVSALHAGDKESYLAINRLAHDSFGKFFFSQAALGTSSLWPVPFALAWMSKRFEGIKLLQAPFGLHIGYVFVFLVCYISIRIYFSRKKKKLPFFRWIEQQKQESKESCGRLRSFFASNEIGTELREKSK